MNTMNIERLAHFLHEVGMLKRTPRSGYQFLGTGQENVAEHSFRTAVIGYVLAGLAGADQARTVFMCLFHDLHESRVGDMNYVNRMYNSTDDRQALSDALQGTGLEKEVLGLFDDLEEVESLEAALAQDADQLDLILNLKEQQDLGNKYASKWLECAKERLRTSQGRDLGDKILEADHTDWWFNGPDKSWWVRRNGKE
ncbi:HD domain-containing protein [Desulfonatronovibrio hydrogenovorans]|uniref:HD domain-containing protein n=1 Tax=Desulfonatronovibrio hydrogenovorans TaxID=53245 RepID=UPI00048CB815|nr:HD domain-containing protein [Desulfonatronovibrio hydrogenovorans]